MRRFNPDKELKKIQHGNKNKIIFSIIFGIILVTIGYSFALYQVRYSKRIIYTKVAPFSSKDIDILAVYLDKNLTYNFPKKSSGYIFDHIDCDNNEDNHVISNWDSVKWTLSLETTDKAKCNVYFRIIKENDVVEYVYNGTDGTDGAIQEFNVPRTGIYKLEVWGAQGGSTSGNAVGGLGGYSYGEIKLEKGTSLFIAIGGAGRESIDTGETVGGYNGGGGRPALDSMSRSGTGGGATHIAQSTGLLADLINDRESILIVAGGGAGGNEIWTTPHDGGCGGGLSGCTSTLDQPGWAPMSATGGDQTTGGSCALSNNCYLGTFGAGNQGSGGGYYGGASTGYNAAGGSGYLKNTLTNSETVSNIQSGNGKAKITFVG